MESTNAPRNPLFALLMSLILPGFGQLYNGEFNKAIWLFLGFAFFCVPGVALVALYLSNAWMMPTLVVSLVLTLGIWLYGMIDGWRTASRKQDYRIQAWQVGSIYLLVFILCNLVALPLLIGYVRDHQVASFRIPAASMEPSVLRGDIIFADMRYNCPGCKHRVRRGDIAIFTYPNDRTLNYIKRVIGLPGDRVQIMGNEVLVNGKSLKVGEMATPDGTLVTEAADGGQWQVRWAAAERGKDVDVTVPPGNVFVLGDNRSGSRDSRIFGTVPLADVVGKARQVWFSSDKHEVRWQRLGKVLN
jgi:signal peptidase I